MVTTTLNEDDATPRDPLARWALENPSGIAYRMLDGDQAVSWKELELRSRKCAALLLERGLKTGDVVAVFLENHLRYFELLWAAHRIGLYYTTISRHLRASEALYIIEDCGARAIFTSRPVLDSAGGLDPEAAAASLQGRFSLGEPIQGYEDYERALASVADEVVLPHTPEGTDFSYSSGTTGAPKGIKRALSGANDHFVAGKANPRNHWKTFGTNTIFLSTAPFYHTAPVRWNINAMRAGGSCVLMEKFDPLSALRAIERFKVTHSQWVPTMFIRLLRLAPEDRSRFDTSSLKAAVHAAAPCPVWVKEAMIDWWGPVLYEFYSGTELVGRTSLDSQEWLAHKGSVGLPEFGAVHIVDEDGNECAALKPGVIWFSGGPRFEYHGAPEKTRQAYNERGWATYGDIGYLDEDGYLYLTDRLANMIISGGVNIYPQETENVLSQHPAVRDVAVVGVPNEEFGEEVKAVVQLHDEVQPTAALQQELLAFCRERLSPLKCPRSVDFQQTLPRTETGKLLKREVRRAYWPSSPTQHQGTEHA